MEDDDLLGIVKRLMREEPELRWTIIRAGLNGIGPERGWYMRLSRAQERRVHEGIIARSMNMMNRREHSGGEVSLPVTYSEYVQIFNDFTKLDWDSAFGVLEQNCENLISVCTELLRDEEGCRIESASGSWEWIAAAFGISDGKTDEELSDLERKGAVPACLSRFRNAYRACIFRSHLHLLAKILRDHFVIDLSSRPRVRDQIRESFTSRAGELRKSVSNDVVDCRRIVSRLIRCANSSRLLRGGLKPSQAAAHFLGFTEISGHYRFCLLTEPEVKTPQPRPRSRTAALRTISYANLSRFTRPVPEVVPEGAYVLPAQGQTLSPKGHRA